jgi:hypothetical protein
LALASRRSLRPVGTEELVRAIGALLVAVASVSSAAGPQSAAVPDARRILAAHLSHGIGADPFDSDLWHDDLNAALIVSARSGATTAELQKIVRDPGDLSARLLKLEHGGFVRREGERVRAAFPILVGRARDTYQELVSEAATSIEKEERIGWQTLLRDLSARGWAEWSYHFVWSETMDSGFTWAPLMAQGHVPPLSRVVVWVVYPAHSFESGTNYYPNTEMRDQWLAVTWRPGAANTIGRVGAQWRTVWSAALMGTATGDERQRLVALGLLDAAGRVLIPVVKKGDPLYAQLASLGEQHVRLVAKHLPLARLANLTRGDDKLTFAMAYHDVSWDVVRRMVESGRLAVPPALREGASDDVSMAGVCAVIDAHPTLLSELKKALGIK